MDSVSNGLIWFSAISAGIMAGVYFTFSVFAMRSFAELGDEAGARAMQSINRVIQQSAFLPLFFLSTLTSAALVVLGFFGMAGTRPEMAIAGGGVYVVGMFVVTVVGNVPLNNKLDAADPASEEGKAVWADYLARWTRLNHVRTLACTASLALLIGALG
ncbi:MAG: anthrone oxygenase family protein [Pseudomonadota bacterium]